MKYTREQIKECVAFNYAHGFDESSDIIRQLLEENDALKADKERIDYLEDTAKESRTGVSIDYAKYSEEGMILENGYRVMRYRTLFNRMKTLRQAIDAARKEQSNGN